MALDKKKVLTISSEVRSLARKELRIRPEGGERANMVTSLENKGRFF